MPAEETAAARTTAAPCPLCGRLIMPGDSAGLHAGLILHLDCYIAVVHADVTVLTYLKNRPREAFCNTCLVGTTGVTFDEAMLTRAWLSARPGIRLDVERCAGCGGRRVTLLYDARD